MLQPGSLHRLHSLHALTPLLMKVWIGSDNYSNAGLHGHVIVTRQAGPSDVGLSCTIYPRNESPNSPRAVVLRVTLTPAAEGTCSLSIAAAHWFINQSSLPLRLFPAHGWSNAVVEASPFSSKNPQLFTLSKDGSSTIHATQPLGAIARLGLGSTIQKQSTVHSSAQSMAVALPRAVHKEDLTAPFSVDAVGQDGPLEIRAENVIAELAVHIGASQGPLAPASSTIVTVRVKALKQVCDLTRLHHIESIALEIRGVRSQARQFRCSKEAVSEFCTSP